MEIFHDFFAFDGYIPLPQEWIQLDASNPRTSEVVIARYSRDRRDMPLALACNWSVW
jgi:hypothetical protein